MESSNADLNVMHGDIMIVGLNHPKPPHSGNETFLRVAWSMSGSRETNYKLLWGKRFSKFCTETYNS